MPQWNFSCEIPPQNIFLISFGQRELITPLDISKNQSLCEIQIRCSPFILYTVKVPFIHIPHMKICLQNPPGNKINTIIIFIMNRKMCKKRKDIFMSSNERLCKDWWASTASGPVQCVLKCRMMSVHLLSLELLAGRKLLIN